MRTAVMSDIHGNLIALEAVLAAVRGLRVDRILCLGDIVGYNPWPNECVDMMRECSIPCIMGNHDRVAVGIEEPEDFNELARDAILWTRSRLTKKNRDFLSGLPDRMFINDSIVLVHGAPRDPDEYILSTEGAGQNMVFMERELGVAVGFFGHTHAASLFVRNRKVAVIFLPEDVTLGEGRAYLINPGSVGQPRDGDARAAYLTHDHGTNDVQFLRAEYDIAAVSVAIGEAGLPAYLAKRLFLGR